VAQHLRNVHFSGMPPALRFCPPAVSPAEIFVARPSVASRSRAGQALGECFAAAFNTARGGFVREALIGGYPRLAAALEEVCARVARDSAVKDAEPALMESQVG